MAQIDPQLLANMMQQRQARGQMMQQLVQGVNPRQAQQQQAVMQQRAAQMQAAQQQAAQMRNQVGTPQQPPPQNGKGALFGGRLGPMYQMGSPEAAAAQQAAIAQSRANGSTATGQMMNGKGSPPQQ